MIGLAAFIFNDVGILAPAIHIKLCNAVIGDRTGRVIVCKPVASFCVAVAGGRHSANANPVKTIVTSLNFKMAAVLFGCCFPFQGYMAVVAFCSKQSKLYRQGSTGYG